MHKNINSKGGTFEWHTPMTGTSAHIIYGQSDTQRRAVIDRPMTGAQPIRNQYMFWMYVLYYTKNTNLLSISQAVASTHIHFGQAAKWNEPSDSITNSWIDDHLLEICHQRSKRRLDDWQAPSAHRIRPTATKHSKIIVPIQATNSRDHEWIDRSPAVDHTDLSAPGVWSNHTLRRSAETTPSRWTHAAYDVKRALFRPTPDSAEFRTRS